MSGLDEEQLGELECRVAELLEEPWDKGEGRPRELTLREALVVTCGYLRQNIVEDVWADIFDVDQSIDITLHHVSHAIGRESDGRGPADGRAPVERAVATLKAWRILFTDYRRPLRTFKSSFRAAIGLYFFKESFA
jgi:hypothetical protein